MPNNNDMQFASPEEERAARLRARRARREEKVEAELAEEARQLQLDDHDDAADANASEDSDHDDDGRDGPRQAPARQREFRNIRDVNALRSVKLNDENWLLWSGETEMILQLYDLWYVVTTPPRRLQQQEKFVEDNLCAMLIITSFMEAHIVAQTRSLKYAYNVWRFLKPQTGVHEVHEKKQKLLRMKLDSFPNASKYLGAAKAVYDHRHRQRQDHCDGQGQASPAVAIARRG